MIVSLFALFLASHVHARNSSVNINEIVDLKLEMANRIAASTNKTYVEYGSGFMSDFFYYEGATGIGLDSLVRTGDCEMIFTDDTITYVYRIGQAFLATFFRKMTVKDSVGSGYFRAHNNSLEYIYTVAYRGAQCSTHLNTLKVSMTNVTAYMMNQDWSSEDEELEEIVQEMIVPAINSKLKLKYSELESNLESIFCRNRGQQLSTQGLDVLRTFLF